MKCIALVSHCVYEEDFKNGVQDKGRAWDGDIIEEKTLTTLIEKIKNDFEISTIYITEDKPSSITTSFFEDDRGIRATSEEIARWKKGKIKLFEHFIAFSIYISATPEELEQYCSYI